jgi:quercetin dioxygenase-like cupin family protein
MSGNEGNICACNGIAKLKEITEHLPKFPNALPAGVDKNYTIPVSADDYGFLDIKSGGYAEYKMDKGDCFSWFIHRSGNDIAIHRWFISKGTIFPGHTHKEKEWLIVYNGAMDLYLDGGRKIELRKGDSYYVLPDVIHWSEYPEDCRFITITIPPAKEFPHV